MQSPHPSKHIPAATLPELTLRGMILGAIITVIFTASNVYLGLKVGLTFSSAIPAAVISMAAVSYTHLTLPTNTVTCRSRWSPYH